MANAQRAKGLVGEREVARIYLGAGLSVRGLEGGGDHLIVTAGAGSIRLHSEVKRQETARPWGWWAQATAEAPDGSVAVVAFRRNRSPWLALLELDDLAGLVSDAGAWRDHLAAGGQG